MAAKKSEDRDRLARAKARAKEHVAELDRSPSADIAREAQSLSIRLLRLSVACRAEGLREEFEAAEVALAGMLFIKSKHARGRFVDFIGSSKTEPSLDAIAKRIRAMYNIGLGGRPDDASGERMASLLRVVASVLIANAHDAYTTHEEVLDVARALILGFAETRFGSAFARVPAEMIADLIEQGSKPTIIVRDIAMAAWAVAKEQGVHFKVSGKVSESSAPEVYSFPLLPKPTDRETSLSLLRRLDQVAKAMPHLAVLMG